MIGVLEHTAISVTNLERSLMSGSFMLDPFEYQDPRGRSQGDLELRQAEDKDS